METLVLEINVASGPSEILIAHLASLGFEGFIEEKDRILAYIPADQFEEADWRALSDRAEIQKTIVHWRTELLPEQNWNRIWESAFEPVMITKDCRVRAGFHEPRPELAFDLVITPRMSFGTAHHETTRLMILEMLKTDLKGKRVLDLGCGTGILSILAEKKGACEIHALDPDHWAVKNSRENIAINRCHRIQVHLATLQAFEEGPFDLILANINRNVLQEVLSDCVMPLRPDGLFIMSGFYREDHSQLRQAAAARSLELMHWEVLNNWVVAVYRKPE